MAVYPKSETDRRVSPERLTEVVRRDLRPLRHVERGRRPAQPKAWSMPISAASIRTASSAFPTTSRS